MLYTFTVYERVQRKKKRFKDINIKSDEMSFWWLWWSLHAYPGFSGGRPGLSESEREREHQDDYPECDARICGERRAEISRAGELEEARGGEDIRERGGGDTASDFERDAKVARHEGYCVCVCVCVSV